MGGCVCQLQTPTAQQESRPQLQDLQAEITLVHESLTSCMFQLISSVSFFFPGMCSTKGLFLARTCVCKSLGQA